MSDGELFEGEHKVRPYMGDEQQWSGVGDKPGTTDDTVLVALRNLEGRCWGIPKI